MNFGEDLSLQVMLAHKSYQQYLNRILNKIEVFQHYQLLLLLSRLGGQTTQKRLCDELRIEKSNMVSIITLLEEKGYVTREVNYKDRRGKLIKLTQQTYDLIERLESSFAQIEEDIAEELTWQEMHNCIRVLGKVNDRFKSLTEKDKKQPSIKQTPYKVIL